MVHLPTPVDMVLSCFVMLFYLGKRDKCQDGVLKQVASTAGVQYSLPCLSLEKWTSKSAPAKDAPSGSKRFDLQRLGGSNEKNGRGAGMVFRLNFPFIRNFPWFFPGCSIDLPRPQPRATTSSCCRVRCPWSRPSAPAAPRAPPKGRCWTHRPPGYGCSIYSLMTLGFHGFS